MAACALGASPYGVFSKTAEPLAFILRAMKQPVAASLDQEEWEEIVGTIAGDNTVLVICPDNRSAATLKSRIEAHLG